MDEKAERFSTDAYPSDIALIGQIQENLNLSSRKDVLRILCDYYTGKTVVDKSTPENCKACSLYNGFFEGKVHCVLKMENKLPIIKKHSLIEAQACSTAPTLITLARKEEFERQIKNLTVNRNYYFEQVQNLRPKAERLPYVEKQLEQREKELQNIKKPHEELLSEKNTLELRVSNMGNVLLERDEKIAILETDNEQLRMQITKLSESELLKENDGLYLKVTDMQNKLDDYELEVKKSEALREKERQILNGVVSQTNSVFGEFKRFLPTSLDPYDIQQYLKAMQKKIVDFEGYLNTVTV